jgi:hypothetical protein
MTRTTATPNSRKRKQSIKIEGLSREPTAQEFGAALKAAGIKGLKFTPLRLLSFVMKLVLKDRITAKEIKLITETHRDFVKEYWGKRK